MNLFKPSSWEDKVVGLLLIAVVLVLVGVFLWAWNRHPGQDGIANADVLDLALKAAGGVVVLLGSYFAARTLNQNRRDTRLNQLLKAAEMRGSKAPAIQAAGGKMLEVLEASPNGRLTVEQQEAIILAALTAAPGDGNP